MPRRNEPTAAVTQEPVASTSMALALPEDVRRDLLAAQRGMIGEQQRLPQVRIMPAGAGLYEFVDTSDTVRGFRGVILGSHARNVLWDRPYGSPPVAGEEETAPTPACQSGDGRFGAPRQGFAHAALQPRGATTPVLAVGTERIECRTCPYNKWKSKGLIPALLRPGETAGTAKGKAVTNQRAVYLLVEGREALVELILPPTSIPAFDEYLAHLLNRGVPVQAVVTEFGQEIIEKNRNRWAQAVFTQGDSLNQESFSRVLAKRSEYRDQIEGVVEELVDATAADDEAEPMGGGGNTVERTGEGEDADEIPF